MQSFNCRFVAMCVFLISAIACVAVVTLLFSCSLQLSAGVGVVLAVSEPEGLLFYIGPVSDTRHTPASATHVLHDLVVAHSCVGRFRQDVNEQYCSFKKGEGLHSVSS